MITEFQLLTLSSVPSVLKHSNQIFEDSSLTFECKFLIFPVLLKDFFQWESMKSNWQEDGSVRPRKCPAIDQHVKKWIQSILANTEMSKLVYCFSSLAFSHKFLNNYKLLVHTNIGWYSHLHHWSFPSSLFTIKKGLCSGFLRRFCIHSSLHKCSYAVLWYFL